MKNINLVSSAFVLTFVLLFVGQAAAQYRPPVRPQPQPTVSCGGVPSVHIRNLRYDDYTRYSRLASTSVAGGGWIQINTSCLRFDGQIVVTLQDANNTTGLGVTAFRLTNVRFGPNGVMAQVPNYPIFRDRSFNVGLFVYGQPLKTANPGTITVR